MAIWETRFRRDEEYCWSLIVKFETYGTTHDMES